ncbi:MAG: S8 family serine peptidase, partial [Acidobacteria bacterium]|nr:S8 family serine peptidase [Acidobacteriota bacterium]
MDKLTFADLTGRGVRVAIIDSGLDPSRVDFARNVVGGVSIQADDDGTLRRSADYGDEAGHGTACAGILRGLAPEAELSIIRIFDAFLSARASVLEAALEYAGEAGAHVINASLGVTDTAVAGRLRDVCRSLQ